MKIHKKFERMLVYTNQSFKLIKLKNWKMHYKDWNSLVYGTDDILVFSRVGYLSFDEILEISISGPVFMKYLDLFNELPYYLKEKKGLLLILNKDIDFISIAKPTKGVFPTPNWKHLELIIKQADKQKSIDLKKIIIE